MSCKVIGITVLMIVSVGTVGAQDPPSSGGPDGAEEANTRQIEEDIAEAQYRPPPTEYGVGVRIRYVAVPKFVLELFLEEVNAGIGNAGFGLEFIRRKGDFEIAVGLEYESLNGSDGFWLEKGDDGISNGETPDFVDFDGFGWITLDANFIFLKQLGESKLAIRYGGGFGIGFMLGEILQTDSVCSGRDINGGDCMKSTLPGGQVNDPADIFPVYPVINALAGLQYRPSPQFVINLDAGIRNALFAGVSGQYLF